MLIPLDDILHNLNSMVQADPDAITRLIGARVVCDDRLGDHPLAQCGRGPGGECVIGPLGLINGMLGIREDFYGHITAVLNNDGSICEFVATSTLRDDLPGGDEE